MTPIPACSPPRDRAFGVLRDATETLVARLPEGRRPPVLMVALHVWSMSHGIASLFCRPDRSRRKLPMAPEDLLEAGLLIYLQSLGLSARRLERSHPTGSGNPLDRDRCRSPM